MSADKKADAKAESASVGAIFGSFLKEYRNTTPAKIQVIDQFLVFAVLTGVIQFAYMLLAGQFPFNSFLSGFVVSVGFFVFTLCLRLQVLNADEFHNISTERAYADFVVCNVILFFVVMTFMG